MQRIGATLVPTKPCHLQLPHIPPRALVDRLVDVDVVGLLLAVFRPVGRHTDSLGGRSSGVLDLPALVRKANLHHLPKLAVLELVLPMEVVQVKTTDVTQDFLRALVAPVLL